MRVEPDPIIGERTGATISHRGSGTLVVTATNQDGATVPIEVPEGADVLWHPPAGWEKVTFSAAGYADEHRIIDPSFLGVGARAFAASLAKWNHLCVAATIASAATGGGSLLLF